MCFIFVHHTRHESRRLALLNPVTGCTEPNPWEEPKPSSCSRYPCIVEPSDARQFCYWHGACCRLLRIPACPDPGYCPSGVAYHAVEPYAGQKGSMPTANWSSLNSRATPSAASLRQGFFSVGADLYGTTHKHAAIATELQAARSSGGGWDWSWSGPRVGYRYRG